VNDFERRRNHNQRAQKFMHRPTIVPSPSVTLALGNAARGVSQSSSLPFGNPFIALAQAHHANMAHCSCRSTMPPARPEQASRHLGPKFAISNRVATATYRDKQRQNRDQPRAPHETARIWTREAIGSRLPNDRKSNDATGHQGHLPSAWPATISSGSACLACSRWSAAEWAGTSA